MCFHGVGSECVGGKIVDIEFSYLKLSEVTRLVLINLFLNECYFDLFLSFQILEPAPLDL